MSLEHLREAQGKLRADRINTFDEIKWEVHLQCANSAIIANADSHLNKRTHAV